MEKIKFKNHIVNIIVGSLLIILSTLSYFKDWMEDYIYYIVGAILLLMSMKRFFYSFKKITSKNATLILVLEFILDLVFIGLLVYYLKHIEIYVGLIIYTRGVSYLLINYIATRKINLLQYILNIGYVTLGTFLIFYPKTYFDYLVIGLAVLIALVGAMFLQAGLVILIKNRKAKAELQKNEKVVIEAEKQIDDLEEKIEEAKKQSRQLDAIEPVENKTAKPTEQDSKPAPVQYNKLTVAELKQLAKEKGLTGYSQMLKSELVKLVKEAK